MQEATKQTCQGEARAHAGTADEGVLVARKVLLGFALLAMACATGCAPYKAVERFPDIQRSISERLGSRIAWDRDGTTGEAVRNEVATLLAQPLTADAAVQVALLNSNSLQATFEDLGVAQADLVQAGLLRNPNLGGFLRYLDGGLGGPNWNLGIDLPLLDPFLVPLRKKLAGVAAEEAVDRVAGAVLRQAADTRVAFYNLQADQQAVEARKVVADLADVAAELGERQYKAGNVDDMALAGQRAVHLQANIALIQAENAARANHERLRRILGLSDSTVSWTVAAHLLPPPESAIEEAQFVERAVASRFDVTAARKETERQVYALQLTRMWWMESVQVGVETERASGGGYQTGPHFSLDIPIFDQKQAAIARQEAIIRQSRRRLADTQDQVRQDVRTALTQMNAAARVAQYYATDVIPLRQQMSAMTERRYQGMLVGVFELLNAKSEETDATIAAIRARQDYWNARSDLELAVGGRLPPPDPNTTRPTTAPASAEAPKLPATQPAKPMPRMPGMPKMPGM